MIEIDWTKCATTPRDHQKEGVKALLRHPFFALMDEVGAGKSKQVIDASQILYQHDAIDSVVVVCPASARGVWANPDPALGEVARHGWESVDNYIIEYSTRYPKALTEDATGPRKNENWLRWIVANYEFIRRDNRLTDLQKYLRNRRYMLVCDEGWALKDHASDQWKATNKLRQKAARIVLLNGTPVAHNPLDLFAQMRLLHPSILSTKYTNRWGREAWTGFVQFRAHYAVLNPNVSFPQVVSFQNLEELREKVRPFVLRRKTRDCFDLPPILDPVLIEAKLSDENWRIYRGMRDNMVAWIDSEGKASVARQAIVRVLRLSQITSGFLGGLEQMDVENDLEPLDLPEMPILLPPGHSVKEIGREKLDALIGWMTANEMPKRILIWCRFRREVERTADVLGAMRPMFKLYGQQAQADREAAVAALNPAIEPDGPLGVVGNALAGGAALNLSGAPLAVNMSHDPKLRVFLQSRGRIDRPGQKEPIRYVDVVATGPKGQRTIDHHILAGLRAGQDIAQWTTATWRTKLMEE